LLGWRASRGEGATDIAGNFPNLPATIRVLRKRPGRQDAGIGFRSTANTGIFAADLLPNQQMLLKGSALDCTSSARD
jgi:hypothetical protein